MERAVAFKKLRRLLGDKFGYRIDADAPGADIREEVRRQIPEIRAAKQAAEEALAARREAVLAADPEYQQRLEEYQFARDRLKDRLSLAHRYKITVGRAGDLFFSVEAQGDSWEDVIRKLEAKRNVPR